MNKRFANEVRRRRLTHLFSAWTRSDRPRLVHKRCRHKSRCASGSPFDKGGRGISPVLHTPVYRFHAR
jgi:hypothetical protein